MEFVRISDKKMKLTLTEEELRRYGVAVEELSADTAARRKMLWTLLDEAKKETGIDAVRAKTLVEVFPGRRGGCEVFVTLLSGKREVHTACYRFASIERARETARRLVDALPEAEGAALYALSDGEVLLSLPLPEREEKRAPTPYSFLSEYGKREKS